MTAFVKDFYCNIETLIILQLNLLSVSCFSPVSVDTFKKDPKEDFCHCLIKKNN